MHLVANGPESITMAETVSLTPSPPVGATCPGCGAIRAVRCPFCSTVGTDFAQAEVDFGRLLNLPGGGKSAQCCGPQGCSPVHPKTDAVTSSQPSARLHIDAAARMLICPTCDEPVQPEFARCCGQCGHDFGEGFEVDDGPPPLEGSPLRIAASVAVIAVFIAAIWVYCWRLFK
jgi:hypothetical protein